MSTAFLIYDGVVALDVFGPFDALRLADHYAEDAGRRAVFRPMLVAVADAPVRMASGPRVLPDRRCASVRPNRVVVPGCRLAEGRPDWSAETRWLSTLRCEEFVGVCTGAFLLAEAGLLDGRRATTHWARLGLLAEAHPEVEVAPDALYVEDGPVWTSAGVTAGIDLAIALIRRQLGPEIALAVARELVVFAHRPGGQSQFSALLKSQETSDEGIYEVQQWVLQNLRADLSIPELARVAAMSPRNFARRFAAETGLTPGKFVQRARIDGARTLLETTSQDLAGVARDCGLQSEETLRRLFVQHLSATPGAYRARFKRR